MKLLRPRKLLAVQAARDRVDRMKTLIPGIAFLFLASTAGAQDTAPADTSEPPAITMELVDLPIEQQTALRCAVAVAIATESQREGNVQGKDWPDLLENNRGREFFVRSMAKLMDDTGIAREGIALRGRKEAEALMREGQLDAVMPACLRMLDATGL